MEGLLDLGAATETEVSTKVINAIHCSHNIQQSFNATLKINQATFTGQLYVHQYENMVKMTIKMKGKRYEV